MIDVLTEYEIQPVKKPKIFWWVFCLYAATVLLALYTDFEGIRNEGLVSMIAQDGWLSLLLIVDVCQPFLLYGLLKRSKLSWCLIPLIQGMYGSMFLKGYFDLFMIPDIPHFDIIKSSPATVFFCLNAVLIVTLILQTRIMKFFEISHKARLIIICIIIALFICIFNFLPTGK